MRQTAAATPIREAATRTTFLALSKLLVGTALIATGINGAGAVVAGVLILSEVIPLLRGFAATIHFARLCRAVATPVVVV